MNVRIIRNPQDHKKALQRIDELIDSDHPEELEELDVLSVLVHSYESEHCPMPPPEPVAALEFVMEQRGFCRKDLQAVLGCTRGRVSEILGRVRPLTLSQIRALHREWHIPWSCLMGEALEQTAS